MAAGRRRTASINGWCGPAPVCGLLAGVGAGGTLAAALGSIPALALALWSTPARAGNQMHPRTPVVWSQDVPCARNVDLEQTSTLTLRYTIPYEDTEITEDETADSRTHQFIALCREPEPGEKLPDFVSQADVEAAIAAGVARESEVDAEDVLEASPRWAGCWQRITGDDERRPITFDASSEPVRWDVSAVPDGIYGVYGFTHEPPFSLWSARPGFVRIGEPGPGAAVQTEGIVGRPGDLLSIAGCVSAGADLRLQWGEPGAWTDAEAEPMLEDAGNGDADEFRFHTALPEGVGEVQARVIVTGAESEPYVAHMREPSVLLETGDDADTGATSDGSGATEPSSQGCRIILRPSGALGGAPWLLLCLARLRRGALRRST